MGLQSEANCLVFRQAVVYLNGSTRTVVRSIGGDVK